MCEFCTKHGDGKIWYKNAANYAQDLLSDLKRRSYIENFFQTTIGDGFKTLGRLEALYRRKGRLPAAVTQAMVAQAKIEHFGQVLPLEEIRELMLKAATVVRMPCACRWAAHTKEVRCCYAISYGPEAWYEDIDMSYFGTAGNEGLEFLSAEEALSQMVAMEPDGAIHTIWTMLTPFIGAVCNCRLEDCLAMRTLSGIKVELMARAEHVAVVDLTRCNGCGLCADVCQFNAIEAFSLQGENRARITPYNCFGCGLCRRQCPTDAIKLHLRQEADITP
ncbi:MAG: 4Fe-4S dicluster domain-containing protein [Deltaproteobacteria bacterium]|nr:4Fe-4S dicluster domain-containing protein [Deltaproteobacteria bacterium]